jgi:hypothetical protein
MIHPAAFLAGEEALSASLFEGVGKAGERLRAPPLEDFVEI